MSVKTLGILFLAAVNLSAAAPSFSRDIRPILQKKCQGCHQPASKMSGLDLTTFDGFSKGGKRGPAFVAERPDDSVIVRYLTAALQPQMPLGEPALPAAEIALVREWIRDGAKNDSLAEAGELRRPVYLQPPVITALRFSPDGAEIAVSGNGEVLIHGVDGAAPLRRLMGNAERILALEYS